MVIRIIRFSLLSALLMSLSIKSISEEQARLSPYDRLNHSVIDDSGQSDVIKVLQNAYVVYDPKGEISLRQQGVEQAGNYAISTDIGKLDGSVARSTTKQIKNSLPVFIGQSEKTGQQMVLTGNLIVKYSSGFDPFSIAREYPLEHLQTFERINTSFYRATDPTQLNALADSVRRRPGVLETTLERLNTGIRPR